MPLMGSEGRAAAAIGIWYERRGGRSDGAMAEEIGSGLQNRVHRCDSGSRLHLLPTVRGEWRNLAYAADLKSVAERLEGSNPSSPTIQERGKSLSTLPLRKGVTASN